MHETNTVTARDKSVHARKKRVLSHALSDSAMRAMEDHILQIVRKFCDCLITGGANGEKSAPELKTTDGWGPPLNFADWSNYFSFDVMGTLCFGESFDMLERGDNRYILQVIMDGTQGLNCVSLPKQNRGALQNYHPYKHNHYRISPKLTTPTRPK